MNKRMIYQRWFLSIILGCGLSLGTYIPVNAKDIDDIPMELQQFVTQLDNRVNARDLEHIKSFYSDQYQTTDELTLNYLVEGIKKLWIDYPDLHHRTEILSWEKKGTNILVKNDRISTIDIVHPVITSWVVKILTTVTGNKISNQRKMRFVLKNDLFIETSS